MVLKYMVSDADLAKGKLAQPGKKAKLRERKAARPAKKKAKPKVREPSSKRRVTKFLLFFLVVVSLGIAGYYLWNAGMISHPLDYLPIKRVVVTAIVYGEENPSAIVSEKVVCEGDVINGCKVIKINRYTIEFEKNGKRFTKGIDE
jgi:hypothetical protein